MSNAEKYLRDKIPTMVGERHVSSMDLSTMISLLNGFHESELKEKTKQVVISETECQHEYRTFVDRVDKTSDCWCIKCLKKYSKLAKLSKNCNPHLLRHCWATHMHESGVDIRYIQEYLGHSSPKTTQIYTFISNSSISNLLNPLA